jgi:hypothetical protein
MLAVRARFLAGVTALAVLTLFVLRPLEVYLRGIAWTLDNPGPISLEQAYWLDAGLLLLLYVSFGVLAARWSEVRGPGVLAAAAASIPITLGVARLSAGVTYQLTVSGAIDSALMAHPSLLQDFLTYLLLAGLHLTTVAILANLMRPRAPVEE